MTYDKIKSLEASILDAIQKHDYDPKELTKFGEECFAAKRASIILENQVTNYQNWNKSLEQEISRHKTCIDNLRGYIDYLEKEAANLKAQTNHE